MPERLWGSRSPPQKMQKRKSVDAQSPVVPKPMQMVPHTKVVTKACGPPKATTDAQDPDTWESPDTWQQQGNGAWLQKIGDRPDGEHTGAQEQKIRDLETKVEELTKMMHLMMRDVTLKPDKETDMSGWQP